MSGPEIIWGCKQGGCDWHRYRLGIATASGFKDILSKGRGKSESKARQTYMMKLLGERITREIADNHNNVHMQRGHEHEPLARAAYEFETDNEVLQAGIILNHGVGFSPDGLVADNGIVEIKSKLPHIHLPLLLNNEVPAEHVAQVQGGLWVSERDWCDFISYCPKMKTFINRVYRDEKYISDLAKEVERFNTELDAAFEKYQKDIDK